MKNRAIIIFEIFLLLLLYIVGCKEEEKNKTEDILQSQHAIITYADPATDGCGWVINIDNTEYHPINLNETYKINGLEISIKYSLLLSEWECPQWEPRRFKQIKIISITLIN